MTDAWLPMTDTWLPLPAHYDETAHDRVFRVEYGALAEVAAEWARDHKIVPADRDTFRTLLVAVDVQNTFCLPDFELFVGGRSGRGAVDDTRRLVEFIYRTLGRITAIAPTMDTHLAVQIFHPLYWIDDEGRHPAPYTLISEEEVRRGVWRVNPAVAGTLGRGDAAALQELAAYYVHRLAAGGKYALTIWPYHAMLGGIGHALVSSLEEAVFFHTVARVSQAQFQVKGNSPFTENYSALKPEVLAGPHGEALGAKNEALIDAMLDYDMTIVAGQAKSHCVAWTISDLLDEIAARDPSLAGRVYLLEDCTSPVVVPEVIDYTSGADDAFRRFAEAGMHVVRSTDPVDTWPGVSRDGWPTGRT